MNDFKKFLLLEQDEFLGQKVGDVLSALQSLTDDSKNMGDRQLLKIAENLVSKMRNILQGSWAKEEEPYLKMVQKSAVALAKAIDDKGDIKEVLVSAKEELERLTEKLGTPINDLGNVGASKGLSKDSEPEEE